MNQKSLNRQSWIEIYRFLKPPKKPIFFGLLGILVASVTFLAFGFGVRLLVDKGFVAEDSTFLNKALVYLGCVILLLSLASYVRYYSLHWATESTLARLKIRMMRHFFQQDRYFYQNQSVGSLVGHMTEDFVQIQSCFSQSLPIILRNILLFLGSLVLLFLTSVKLASLSLCLIPVIVLPSLWIIRKIKLMNAQIQSKQAGQTQFLIEAFSHLSFIQSSTKESYFEAKYQAHISDALMMVQRRLSLRSLLIMIVFMLVFSGIGMVLWVGGHDVLSKELTPGSLSSFVFYAIIAASSLSVISENQQELLHAKQIIEKYIEFFHSKPEIQNIRPIMRLDSKMPSIVFSDVSFAYPGAFEKKAIKNLSFTINAGEKIGLIGKSGSGKSTLFRLLLRLYDPEEGKILWNGLPINCFSLKELRSQIAYIPQEPVLFSASIRENLTLGDHFDENVIIKAAQKGHCYDFIKALPKGFDTLLAPTKSGQGIELSGGEKQRIALTRSFLKNPKLLLLDEVTNALDPKSEAYVQDALQELMVGRTCIMISHKIENLSSMDRILNLEDGYLMKDIAFLREIRDTQAS